MITVKYEITFCQKFRSNLMPAHQLVGQCSTITPPTVRHYHTADSAALSNRRQCGTITPPTVRHYHTADSAALSHYH